MLHVSSLDKNIIINIIPNRLSISFFVCFFRDEVFEHCLDLYINLLALKSTFLGRVQTSNFSLPNLARQRKMCRCELKHVTKSHCQIFMAKISELS